MSRKLYFEDIFGEQPIDKRRWRDGKETVKSGPTVRFIFCVPTPANRPDVMMTTREDPAERSHLRLFYRNWHPTRFGKLVNGVWAWLSGLGLMPGALLTLQVRGRRSGLLRNNVLVVATHGGQRYLVSMLGDGSEWVRNVRATGGEAFIKRGRLHRVRLTEVPMEERAPILKAYCRVATSGRRHFPIPYDAPPAEFRTIAADYPVFRIDPA